MDKNEIYALAYRGEKMPRDADFTDCGLYYRLRELFDNYKLGIMPQTVCTAKKAEYFAEYDQRRLWERIHKDFMTRQLEAEVTAREAFTEHKRPLCVKMYDIICGYDRRENGEINGEQKRKCEE